MTLYSKYIKPSFLDEQVVHQLGGQIPWKHNCVLLDKVKDPEQRIWYIQKTIGIILCRSKKKSVVEYALRGMSQPIGVSTYRTTAALPDEFKTKLPSIEDLQHEIEAVAAVVEEFEQDISPIQI